jgi:hypothetical protein
MARKGGNHTRGHYGGLATPTPTVKPLAPVVKPLAHAAPTMKPVAHASTHSASLAKKGGRRQRGGSGAASWTLKNFGGGNDQWNNVFQGQGSTGNLLKTVPGAPAVGHNNIAQGSMKGGKRSRKGGFWGHVISQALVPFGLWGAQNRFGKRMTRRNK